MIKTVIEETQEICSLCGGRGTEYSHQSTAGTMQCRGCGGNRYIVTKRVTRTVFEENGGAPRPPEPDRP